ncbi:hypothetical protein [Amycolatopsis sp. NBC_01286]|uniref:hypothetical protein n=2 Tax=unclassified Amycolatopsis TaxID=2618356 RepID=UPI002E152FC1|nr:hypothetical protein OG570_16315 [Amycolatopsis sp. NBC_01286]
MQTVSFWQAWGLWFDGRSVAGFRLWGLPVLWWGRFGKLGQFTGGLAAIIDIVGVARITGWGERLRARPVEGQRQTLAETWRRSRVIFRAAYRDLLADYIRPKQMKERRIEGRTGEPKREPLDAETRRVKRILVTVVLVWAALMWALTIWARSAWDGGSVEQDLPWWVAILVVVLTFPLSLMAVFTGISLGLNLLARAWPLVVYGLFVRPPLVLLRGPQPDRSLRVIGVLLVVVGFAFDLLAS